MEEMFDVILAKQTVGWLELVMNHSSFSQTVENIFTLSFLVSMPRRTCSHLWRCAIFMTPVPRLHVAMPTSSYHSKQRLQELVTLLISSSVVHQHVKA